MMKYLALLLLCLLLLTAGSAAAGVPKNVKLTVVTASRESGKELQAEAIVVRINTSEQMKIVALELLEVLKVSYPNHPSYRVAISNDGRMMKVGNFLAVATFSGGKTFVTGGIPSNMDIRVMRASRVEVQAPHELGMQVAYEVELLKKGTAGSGPTATDKAYLQVAGKRKLKVVQVRQIHREITQYYKAFAGKPL